MAAITSTVLAIGGAAYKGFSAIDAAKSQSREAGRLTDQADELERNALADIEQNRLEAVQAPMQIFDTTNELQTLDGSTILEAAAEGDQRGVQATAGKIKATQDAARTEARDTMADIQLDLDTQTAKEGNRKGELVSGMKDERAIEKSLEADAMQENADALEMAGTGDLVSAGTSAFSALNSAFGSKAGKVADGLMEGDSALSKTDALAKANKMIAAGTVPQSGFQKGLSAVGGALSKFTGVGDGKDFDESKLGEFFSEDNLTVIKDKAKAAGVGVMDFLSNLFKKKQ